MAAVKDNNFISIQGWMRTKLNLKGYELIVYALIYGFSQDENSKFSGTRRYIAEWCGCSLRTVDNTLASLLAKKLIVKHEKYVNGVRACDYAANLNAISSTPAQTPAQAPDDDPQPLITGSQAPAHPKDPDPTEEVVDHLNLRAGTRYKATTPNTRKLVKARLKEGFTVEDMKLVIDKKCSEWLTNGDMAKYLRPETLFGAKFESYLNARTIHQPNRTNAQYNQPTTQYVDNGPITILDAEGHVAECTRENGWF